MPKGGDGIQVDKGGFVRIHHTILEMLATAPLTGGEFRCLMFLFRATYGYNKKEDKISLAQWSEGTGMKRQNVWSILQTLRKRNIIFAKTDGRNRAMTWGFNKYHEQWDAQSVMAQHDKTVMAQHDKTVMPEDYRPRKSVMAQHDKTVIPPSHTRDLKDIKTTTTTTTEGGGSSFESLADPQADVLRCWRENMEVPLTPIITADLKACIAGYGATNVIEAIAIAVGAETRTLRYVKGVLNRRGSAVNGNGEHTRKVLVDDD